MDEAVWLALVVLLSAPVTGCLAEEEPGDSEEEDQDPSAPEDGSGEDDGGEGDEPQIEWTNRSNVPTARTEVATTLPDEELYVIGGFEADDQPSRVVEVLDLAEDEWRTAASLPTPLHHASAVAIGEEVHVFGGYNAIPFQATPTHLVYEPGADEWTQAEPLPNARGGHGAALLNGSVYLAGGVGADGALLAAVDVYHADNGTYTQAPELPTPRDHLGVAASEQWIHAIGGRNQSLDTNQATHEILVPGQEWVEASPMPTARGGVDATSLDGHIVVAGGEASDETFAEVEAWNPIDGSWTVLPDMPTARHGLGVDAYGRELITSAGGPEPGLTVSDAVEMLDLAPGGSGGD